VDEPTDLPLPTLLSQALAAFTIEFDNTVEQRMPHHTATGPAAKSRVGPWLISQAMRMIADSGLPWQAL
jgi:hypothetical protein